MKTNFATTSYSVGKFNHNKVILVAIETILCVRYFAQLIEMLFECPIIICHMKKFAFKILIFMGKNIKKSRG